MTRASTLITLLFLTSLLFFACGPGPEEKVTSEVDSPTSVAADPSPNLLEEAPMEEDVAEFSRNADPATVAEEKMPVPVPETDAPAKPAPPKPQKPAMDAVRTEDKPVVATSPAPPTSPAPASAPTTEAGNEPKLGTAPPNTPPATPEAPAPPDHSAWNALLQRHVNAKGNVNYAAFKAEEEKLDAYLATLAAESPKSDWPRNASMAYWINAYNAFTVKRILNDYPLKSITDLDGGKPWDVKWIELGGKTYSLNNIEHDIIRPRYQDPRIHFAVNCAAASCPPIPNQAFTTANLNSLLESRTRTFINNPRYNQLGEEIRVSKIFDWYAEDFGDLRSYLNKYLATPIAEGKEIGFKEYDWSLNAQ